MIRITKVNNLMNEIDNNTEITNGNIKIVVG